MSVCVCVCVLACVYAYVCILYKRTQVISSVLECVKINCTFNGYLSLVIWLTQIDEHIVWQIG